MTELLPLSVSQTSSAISTPLTTSTRGRSLSPVRTPSRELVFVALCWTHHGRSCRTLSPRSRARLSASLVPSSDMGRDRVECPSPALARAAQVTAWLGRTRSARRCVAAWSLRGPAAAASSRWARRTTPPAVLRSPAGRKLQETPHPLRSRGN